MGSPPGLEAVLSISGGIAPTRAALARRGAVAADVVSHLASASGMADQYRVVQIERVEQRRQVVGVAVHVIAVPGLAGAAMAAPIMRNDAIALGGHEERLVVPGVGVEGPAMAEDDGLSRAPVLVEDRRSICCADRACTHEIISSFLCENRFACCVRTALSIWSASPGARVIDLLVTFYRQEWHLHASALG